MKSVIVEAQRKREKKKREKSQHRAAFMCHFQAITQAISGVSYDN